MVFVSGKEVHARVRNKYEETQLDLKLMQIIRKANSTRELYAQQTKELLEYNREYQKTSGWSPHAVKPRRAELQNGLLGDIPARLTPWIHSVNVPHTSSSHPVQNPLTRPHTALHNGTRCVDGKEADVERRVLPRRAKSAHAALFTSPSSAGGHEGFAGMTHVGQKTRKPFTSTDNVDGWQRKLSYSDVPGNAFTGKFKEVRRTQQIIPPKQTVAPQGYRKELVSLTDFQRRHGKTISNESRLQYRVNFVSGISNENYSYETDENQDSDSDVTSKHGMSRSPVSENGLNEPLDQRRNSNTPILPRSASIQRRDGPEFKRRASSSQSVRSYSVMSETVPSNHKPHTNTTSSESANSRRTITTPSGRRIKHFNPDNYIPPQERYKQDNFLLLKKRMFRRNVTQITVPVERMNTAFSRGARRQALKEMVEENSEKIESEKRKEPCSDDLQQRVNEFLKSVSVFCPPPLTQQSSED